MIGTSASPVASESSLAQFRDWTKAILFLQTLREDNMIKIPRGDLITDAAFRGSIYLKGLSLRASANDS